MDKVVLSEGQFNFIQEMITDHFSTYIANKDVEGMYLSSYIDADNVPIVELTLVTRWFQSNYFKKGKVIMGFYDCPKSSEVSSQPLYVLSMADVKRYEECIKAGCVSDEDTVMQEELATCNRIMFDRNGIIDRFVSLKNGKTYSIGTGKENFDLPIAMIN